MQDSSRGSNAAAQTTKSTGREKLGCGSWGQSRKTSRRKSKTGKQDLEREHEFRLQGVV